MFQFLGKMVDIQKEDVLETMLLGSVFVNKFFLDHTRISIRLIPVQSADVVLG
jgi:hypothetical protein